MKISIQWLKELVEIPADLEALRQKLTLAGLAVDAVEASGDDTVLELDVTTNRPDCLSHVGVAREVAAIYDRKVRKPEVRIGEVAGSTSDFFAIAISDPDLCGRYSGRLIRGVTVGPSPGWLKKRLDALGIRSIDNVTDVTNFVMMELGQPLHAFDAATLKGGKIAVRRADAGERLSTIDGIERPLDPTMLIIADAERPVAIAGIMGGKDTEISTATRDVFLESAYFLPGSIRKTARRIALSTEASYRFERGADIESVLYASDRAAALIQEVAGGELLRPVDAFPGQRPRTRASLRRERIAALLGAPVEDAAVESIFRRLELAAARTPEGWDVEVPGFRVDISTEVDLLEEIARQHGFDKFPSTLPPSRSFGAPLPRESRVRTLREAVSACGYSEICTYAFSDEETERRFRPETEPVRLQNPMSEDMSILRMSLVPSMLRTLQWNLNRGSRDLQFYELGKEYRQEGESPALILAGCGSANPSGIHSRDEAFEFFHLKGDVERIVESFRNSSRVTAGKIPKYYHPGRSARIGNIAIFGELHPEYADLFKFRQRVCLAEIAVDMLLEEGDKRSVRPAPRYPAVKRDFSLLLERATPYAAVEKALEEAALPELVRVEPFDRLESGPFPESRYSLSISVIYQSTERTLTDVEVEGFDRKILEILEARIGATLRK